jgi:hypothetical protein
MEAMCRKLGATIRHSFLQDKKYNSYFHSLGKIFIMLSMTSMTSMTAIGVREEKKSGGRKKFARIFTIVPNLLKKFSV